MNKKGLSDVITNVLIILLVIVSIGMIAAFLVPLLKGTTDKAQGANTCLTIDVLAKKCEVAQNGANDYNVSVLISRGVGKTEISEAKVILEKEDGSSNITNFANPSSLTEYASLSHSLARINFKPKSASVAVKLKGANNACETSERVSCKIVSSVAAGGSTGGGGGGTPPGPADVTAGLIANWKFEEGTYSNGAAVLDSSGNGYTSTANIITNNAITSVQGLKAQTSAISFNDATNANNFVLLNSGPFTGYPFSNPTTGATTTTTNYPLTISMWLKTTQTSRGLFGQYTGGGYVPSLYLDSSGNIRSSLFYHNNPTTMSSSTPINDGNWKHIVTTYESTGGGTEKLYINGNLVTSRTGISQYSWSIVPYLYRLGKINYAGWDGQSTINDNFLGSVDEMRVYNRALTGGVGGEVEQLYNFQRP